MSSHPISSKTILISSSHLCLSLLHSLFSSGSPTIPVLFHVRPVTHLSHHPEVYRPNNIRRRYKLGSSSWNAHILYVAYSVSIGPLVDKNTIIYFDVWNPNLLQCSLFGNAHTSSSGPAIAGNISGKLLVESCTAGLSRSA